MALSVALVLLDVIKGRIRGSLIAWIALVTCAYDVGFVNLFSDVPWASGAQEHLPEILILIGSVLVITDIARRRVRWYLVAWVALMIGAFASWPFTHESIRGQLPFLFWQVVLVPSGLWLAAGPLLEYIRNMHRMPSETASIEPIT